MVTRNLPDDLLLEILARLPVKSLLRFKCVSKSFFNLISDPVLVTKQLQCSNSATKNLSKHPLIFHLDAVKRNPYISLLSDEKSELPENLELPFAEKDLSYIIPYGHCNGILCLYGAYFRRDSVRKDNLVLWNPATRKAKVVPSPHLLPTNAVLESYVHGFGFDPKTKDFKIVSMIMKFNREDGEFPSAEVYNLSTNSWRILDVKVPAYSLRYPKSGSYLNGIYHWLTNDHNDKAILCFDLSNEVFYKMKLPQPVIEGRINEGEFIRDKNVAVIDDHIAYAVVCCNEKVDCYFEVWIMKEYNVEDSWTRKFKIGAIPEVDLFLGFWNEGEILAADENGLLVWYNHYTHRVQKFPIHVEPVMFHSFNYLESIVPL